MQLDIKNIYKSFGDKEVLKNVTISATNGMALGLLGRNGAGKTTTIRIIMDVFLPDKGEVLLDGKPLNKAKIKIGYLPEERGLYPKKTVLEQMVYLGELKGLKDYEAKKKSLTLLEKLDVSEYANKKLDTLSKGNQQKIQLAVAVIHDPDVVILDEPFSGLDPVNAQLLKDLVNELVKNNKIVLFSSHQMSYVEEFCKNICILNKGEIVLEGSIKDIKKSYERNRFKIIPENNVEGFLKAINEFSGLKNIIENITTLNESVVITLNSPKAKTLLLQTLVNKNIAIDEFSIVEPTLSEIFVSKVGDNNEAH